MGSGAQGAELLFVVFLSSTCWLSTCYWNTGTFSITQKCVVGLCLPCKGELH